MTRLLRISDPARQTPPVRHQSIWIGRRQRQQDRRIDSRIGPSGQARISGWIGFLAAEAWRANAARGERHPRLGGDINFQAQFAQLRNQGISHEPVPEAMGDRRPPEHLYVRLHGLGGHLGDPFPVDQVDPPPAGFVQPPAMRVDAKLVSLAQQRVEVRPVVFGDPPARAICDFDLMVQPQKPAKVRLLASQFREAVTEQA